jgi:zinc protease
MLMAINILRSRLFEEVRTKRNLTYAVSSGLGRRPYNYGFLYATPKDPDTTLKVIYDEVEKLQEVPVDPEDLSDQIEVFLTRFYMDQETNAAQASTLGSAELVGGGWEQSLVFIQRIKGVTPADIQRVARGYIKNIHWGVVGSPQAVDPKLFKSR